MRNADQFYSTPKNNIIIACMHGYNHIQSYSTIIIIMHIIIALNTNTSQLTIEKGEVYIEREYNKRAITCEHACV